MMIFLFLTIHVFNLGDPSAGLTWDPSYGCSQLTAHLELEDHLTHMCWLWMGAPWFSSTWVLTLY